MHEKLSANKKCTNSAGSTMVGINYAPIRSNGDAGVAVLADLSRCTKEGLQKIVDALDRVEVRLVAIRSLCSATNVSVNQLRTMSQCIFIYLV